MTALERVRALVDAWQSTTDQNAAPQSDRLLAAARREGAAEMRERAAATIRAQHGFMGGEQFAAVVEAIPLTPEEPT